jgi:CRP-like cAMP-binding protein
MIKEVLRFLFIDDILKEDVAFLDKIALFHGLPYRALAKVALIVFKKTYITGEIICTASQEANVVYIIKSGRVKLTGINFSEVVERANFFGGISLIENRDHAISAVSLQESELYLIYRAKFDDITASDNKIGLIVMKNLISIITEKPLCFVF